MLNSEQIRHFHQFGYVFLKELYSASEIELFKDQIPDLLKHRDERVVMEKSGKAVRSIYGVHESNSILGALARHQKLAQAAQELLNGSVYVYQSKINIKDAFDGDVWDWHQDYIYWKNEDGMPSSSVLTAALFLDDITEFNSPVIMIPGSHRHGVTPVDVLNGKPSEYQNGPAWISNLTARLKYTVDRGTLADQVNKNGMVAEKGRAGSVLFFDGNVIHASQPNISPHSRTLLLYTYNRVDNAPPPTALHRPNFLASRNSTPIQLLSSDIRELAPNLL